MLDVLCCVGGHFGERMRSSEFGCPFVVGSAWGIGRNPRRKSAGAVPGDGKDHVRCVTTRQSGLTSKVSSYRLHSLNSIYIMRFGIPTPGPSLLYYVYTCRSILLSPVRATPRSTPPSNLVTAPQLTPPTCPSTTPSSAHRPPPPSTPPPPQPTHPTPSNKSTTRTKIGTHTMIASRHFSASSLRPRSPSFNAGSNNISE